MDDIMRKNEGRTAQISRPKLFAGMCGRVYI
jgi:hypothetical protein